MALNPLRRIGTLLLASAAMALAALASTAAAADEPLAASLREQVITLNVPERPAISLQTTLYLPPGDGPFPLVIINHGKAPGNPRFQERSRFLVPAREFVSRGYAVAIPMRRGFADSSGRYIPSGCDISGNGVAEADDIVLALLALSRRPEIDARRTVIVGQSHGGLASVAFGARNLSPVVGVVNFSGGLRVESCRTWQRELEHAMGEYGAVSRVPSLWFYGDNDSYFSVDTWQAMYKAYTDAGGQARLVAFGKFRDDAHDLFASNAGVVIWVPPVREFFQQLGLNFDIRYRIVLADHETAPPARTTFAELAAPDKLPFVNDAGRQDYAAWLNAAPPRAFAVGDGGAWGRSSGNAKAMRLALDNCNAHKPTQPCRLYAVDDAVVWAPN